MKKAAGVLLLGASLALAVGCKAADNGSQALDDGVNAPAAGASGNGATLPVAWIHGADLCQNNADPKIQTFSLDDNTYILRQNKCAGPILGLQGPTDDPQSHLFMAQSFEAPFVYLIFGADKVLMLDSGSVADATYVPMRATVDKIISDWLAKKGWSSIQLVLAHTHSHGDHVAGDSQFTDRPNTTIVAWGQDAVGSFFGWNANWTSDPVPYDLGGGRVLQVMPIPGHLDDHIAIYDAQDALLLTGDTLYPGHLFINDWAAYRASVKRLAAFAADKPVRWVLGAHIEAKNTPIPDAFSASDPQDRFFQYGEIYQPSEHTLELFKPALDALNQALIAIGDQPKDEYHTDFHIQPNN